MSDGTGGRGSDRDDVSRGASRDAVRSGAESPGADLPAGGAAGLGLSRPWQQVPWVVIDVEGNGQRPPDLIEAACLPIDGGVPGRVRTWLVRPPRPITGLVRRIHGISNADVATAPTTADVAAQIRAALAGRVVIGHHVHVDLAVLRRELDGWTPPAVLDTLRLARAVWPGLPSYSLDNLTAAARLRPGQPSSLPPAGIGGRHRAGYDTAVTAALFLALARTVTDTVTDTDPQAHRSARPAVQQVTRSSAPRPAIPLALRAEDDCCPRRRPARRRPAPRR